MEAYRKLERETMTTYGKVIDLLDRVVAVNTERTFSHDMFSKSHMQQRRSQEEYCGYYRYVASFFAQRACQTAQANALLLRHGFQDQAFELWRTLVNLHEHLENMIGDEQEREAEKFLSAGVAEMKFLNDQAKKSGSRLGRMFADSDEDRTRDIADRMKAEYGTTILKRDGWKSPNPTATDHTIKEPLKAEMAHSYRLASKLQHGAPLSTAIGADFEMRPLRNPLEHKNVGIPVQCMMTGYMLHAIVTMFCSTTEEERDFSDEVLTTASESALRAISQISGPPEQQQ